MSDTSTTVDQKHSQTTPAEVVEDGTFALEADERGRLTLKRPGREDAADVRVRRAFPWSVPGRFVSIRSSEGKELLMVEDLAALPAELRAVIDRALAAGSFIPRITKVDGVDTSFGHQTWRVQTDRGPATFRVQEREDIRFLADGRFTLKDADGNLYEMPPLERLDRESRRAVEALV